MEKRIFESLSHALGAELSEDLTQYILSVETEADFEDYMTDLFDFTNDEQIKLYQDIKAAKFGSKNSNQNATDSKLKLVNSNTKSAVQKPFPSLVLSEKGRENRLNVKYAKNDPSFKQEPVHSQEPTKKKTKKFKKFQLHELQKGFLKEGRNPCQCQATRHKLINNCLECGRIVCEQEGSGPCFFCDNMVCTEEEQDILNSEDTKEGDALYQVLTHKKKSAAWKAAIQSRNKLLEFDSAASRLTKIIDDEHDYYDANNTWKSQTEREKILKDLEKDLERKYPSNLGARKIILDLCKIQIVEGDYNYEDDNDDNLKEENIDSDGSLEDQPVVLTNEELLETFKHEKAVFKENKLGVDFNTCENKAGSSNQNEPVLDVNDTGMCLSLHQPWASLVVLGIKQHEGRTWYTPHRGTLWITSASKTVSPDDVQLIENFYKSYYDGLTVRFPEMYPTGSLLGSVTVTDCLSQEEYRKKFPAGESDSPYVLICTNPQQLMVPYPMKGEHKIYKMNSNIHKMAREALKVKKKFAK